MRARYVVFLAGLSLAAVAACLNPQPLPPDEGGNPQATGSSGSSGGDFSSSSSSSGGKQNDDEIVPPSPLAEAGAGVPDADSGTTQGLDDAASDAGADAADGD